MVFQLPRLFKNWVLGRTKGMYPAIDLISPQISGSWEIRVKVLAPAHWGSDWVNSWLTEDWEEKNVVISIRPESNHWRSRWCGPRWSTGKCLSWAHFTIPWQAWVFRWARIWWVGPLWSIHVVPCLHHCLSLLSTLAWDLYRAEGFTQSPGTGYKTDQMEETCFPILPILHLSLLIPNSSKVLFHSCSELRISHPIGTERLRT